MLRLFQQRILEKLNSEKTEIKLRGWDVKNREVVVPSELSSKSISVGDLTAGYCPTYRDFYLSKVKKMRLPETWDRYAGKAIHKLYKEIGAETQTYLLKNRKELAKIDLLRYLRKSKSRIVNNLTEDMSSTIEKLIDKPNDQEVKKFVGTLERIIEFEGEMASAFCDYIISSKIDVEIASEFSSLAPVHIQELSLNAPPLGLSKGVKPDFLIGENFIGDIKTGPPFEFHRLTVAAYALAYEYETKTPVDYGVVFHLQISVSKRVPLYSDTEFFVISDMYRRAVLDLRNKKLDILVNRRDPGDSKNVEECNNCPFHPSCREVQ